MSNLYKEIKDDSLGFVESVEDTISNLASEAKAEVAPIVGSVKSVGAGIVENLAGAKFSAGEIAGGSALIKTSLEKATSATSTAAEVAEGAEIAAGGLSLGAAAAVAGGITLGVSEIYEGIHGLHERSKNFGPMSDQNPQLPETRTRQASGLEEMHMPVRGHLIDARIKGATEVEQNVSILSMQRHVQIPTQPMRYAASPANPSISDHQVLPSSSQTSKPTYSFSMITGVQ